MTMNEYFVHPKHTIMLRGIERKSGQRVKATAEEAEAFAGKLLTAQEFEDTCIDLQSAAEFEAEKAQKAHQASIDAQRGVKAPEPQTHESEE
jgi:hypothetical protein